MAAMLRARLAPTDIAEQDTAAADATRVAEIAVALWGGHLRHNPGDPQWFGRDHFVIAGNRGVRLSRALMRLAGYESPTLPDAGADCGVTSGIARAVMLALEARALADTYNRPGHEIVNRHCYALMDEHELKGELARESCALAGSRRLGRLVVLCDVPQESAGALVRGWFLNGTSARLRDQGWQVLGPVDGHDAVAIGQAIALAKAESDAPCLIVCRTRADTPRQRGAPDGPVVSDGSSKTSARWDARMTGSARQARWRRQMADYRRAHPELAADLDRIIAKDAARPGACQLFRSAPPVSA